MTFSIKNIAAVVLIVGAVFVVGIVSQLTPRAEGSTARGSEYQSTTTQAVGGAAADTVLLSTNGTLGSIILTGTSTGALYLYDATTSNSSNRTGQKATSTILVASIPIDAPAGTYTFDASLYNGLYLYFTGTAPTTTITFRQ